MEIQETWKLNPCYLSQLTGERCSNWAECGMNMYKPSAIVPEMDRNWGGSRHWIWRFLPFFIISSKSHVSCLCNVRHCVPILGLDPLNLWIPRVHRSSWVGVPKTGGFHRGRDGKGSYTHIYVYCYLSIYLSIYLYCVLLYIYIYIITIILSLSYYCWYQYTIYIINYVYIYNHTCSNYMYIYIYTSYEYC